MFGSVSAYLDYNSRLFTKMILISSPLNMRHPPMRDMESLEAIDITSSFASCAKVPSSYADKYPIAGIC